MESFKSIQDYPCIPSTVLTRENLAKYNDYIAEGIRQAAEFARQDLLARANRTVIHFHNGR